MPSPANKPDTDFGDNGGGVSKRGFAYWTNYAWRFFGSTLGFAGFGIGGFVISVTWLPLLIALPINKARKHRLARITIRRAFKLFITIMTWLGVLTLKFHNRQYLTRPGSVIIANHPSLIDVVLLIACADVPTCIIKTGVKRNPATWGPVTAAGYLVNEGGADTLASCTEALANGECLIVFPEGSRSPKRGLLPFQRGAANIVLQSGAWITPVVIHCEPPTLKKGMPWYRIAEHKIRYSITAHPPRRAEFNPDIPRSNAARAITRELEQFFHTQLKYGTKTDLDQ